MIEQNLEILKKEIDFNKVCVVAVSKTKSVDMIEEAYNLGIRDFGENKVQEFVKKYEYFKEKGYSDIKWHFIGHLQTNKVKYIVDKVYMIHSVDRLKLYNKIKNECIKKESFVNILIQVNATKEEQKSGVYLSKFNDLYSKIREDNFENIKLKGLMTIGPTNGDKNQIIESFKKTKNIYDNIKADNENIEYLSIGMSGDYKLAIEEGSNMVRIGSLIFGKRSYDL